MTRDQLIQKLRRYARKTGKELRVDTKKGKGSHYRVTLDGKTSTLQHDLNPGRIERFLKTIEVDPAAL